VVDVLPIGQFAAIEVEAPGVLAAERTALRTLGDRYECIEVVETVRTDDFVPAGENLAEGNTVVGIVSLRDPLNARMRRRPA
jgi:hypothetical protein